MPHINLSFPFLPPDQFEEAQKKLQEEFKDFNSFDITLSSFDHFN
jgi:hypothetical protein